MPMETQESSFSRNLFPKVSENAFGTSPNGRHTFPTGIVSSKGKTYKTKFTPEQVTVTKNVVFEKDKAKGDLQHSTDAEELNFITITKTYTRKDNAAETNTLGERIKKIWNNISDKSVIGKISVQRRDETVTYMLNCIDMALTICQEKVRRFEQERIKIDQEVKELSKDVHFITTSRDTEFDDNSKSGEIRRNLRHIREHIHKQIREVFERWKTDRHQVTIMATPLLKDIQTLLYSEPLCFSQPKQYESGEYKEGVSPKFQKLISGICGIKHCLTENFQSFQKKFVRTDLYVELQENNRRLNNDINHLKEEKDELLNRLSKIAGANLTDNNPNIADLSDPNRATKLAEQYSELYDNPWTDAFEELGITDERKCIDYLLDILVESYKLCGTISRNQQCWLTDTLLCPTKCISPNTLTEKMKTVDVSNLSAVQSRSLADLRKQCAEVSVGDVKIFISNVREKWMENESLKTYTFKCIELCWLMHLQTPPVYLDAHIDTNSTFDTNKYKQYTKSGSKIDYLVWPNLLLHKDGPILCKGVAQGK